MFGWLPAAEGNKVNNAGFWDQRFALQWIQNYIHLFGGDPTRVVAIGESSGAGSIMHHMTAFSGERAPLFSRAIMINPTWDISPDDNAVAVAMERVRRYSGLSVDDIRDLDDIPSADLQEVNRETIEASPRGRFTYGPVVDNSSFVAAQPLAVLREGGVSHQVPVSLWLSGNQHERVCG